MSVATGIIVLGAAQQGDILQAAGSGTSLPGVLSSICDGTSLVSVSLTAPPSSENVSVVYDNIKLAMPTSEEASSISLVDVSYTTTNTTVRPPRTLVFSKGGDEVVLRVPLTPSLPATTTTTTIPTVESTLASKKLLVIGAGGIGCELVKCLVLVGFRHLHLVDLDTIDATNLNRQFLFRTWHVDMGKAEVVAQSMKDWFSHLQRQASSSSSAEGGHGGKKEELDITPQQANIKDSQFDTQFFDGFDMVLNGLDNISARKHVNRMCMQVSAMRRQRAEDGGNSGPTILPLVESGTMGFNGQMVPILRGATACYDCVPKGPDKASFAVCTIHARPTTMVHCVHYAKELYDKIFGPSVAAFSTNGTSAAKQPTSDENNADAGDEAAVGSSGEMGFLEGVITIEGLLEDPSATHERLLTLLFHNKIAELLQMKGSSSWGASGPPVAHPTDLIHSTCAIVQPQGLTDLTSGDFDVPTAQACFALLRLSLLDASRRAISTNTPESHPFKKEDPIAVRFVAAVSNLRATSFHIPPQSLHEITTIAGSIIPAISSTNAIVAASVANAAVQIATGCSYTSIPAVYVRKAHIQQRRRVMCNSLADPTKRVRIETNQRLLVHSVSAPTPAPSCLICSEANEAKMVSVVLNAHLYTMGQFVARVLQSQLSLVAPGVQLGDNILYEHGEYEKLKEEPLSRWVGGDASDVASSNSIVFFVEDLQQDVEWQVTVVHESENRTDLAHFAVNGQEMTPLAERTLTSSVVNTTAPATATVVASIGTKRPRDEDTDVNRNAAAADEDDIMEL